MCGRGASPESPRSKFAVVGCRTDSLTIFCSSECTCTKCITELNTTADASKTRSKIVNSLRCYQLGILLILHGSLLNHMTTITKVGASYVDHMNDDAPEVDNFFCGCYQALSSPRFWRREPGDGATRLLKVGLWVWDRKCIPLLGWSCLSGGSSSNR